MSDIKLYKNKKEQELYENLADLYAIIKTTEKLERAYVKDAVSSQQYEQACEKLIGQFKMLKGSLQQAVPSIETFMSTYNMQCPMAATRLIYSGMPATIEHRAKQQTGDPEALAVAETVQHFITAMDSLKLNMAAVDQICPILADVLSSMRKVAALPPQFGPTDKIREWYSRLYQKPATYELPPEDVRQLLYELEAAYSDFLRFLRSSTQA